MMKDNKLIKQTKRTNMKMADVEKIVDIQQAKTLKNEKNKAYFNFLSKKSFVPPYISTKIFIDASLFFFLGCPIIAHNF